MIPFITCNYVVGAHSTLANSWKWNDVTNLNNKLYLIEEGELLVKVNNESVVAKKGDLVLIPSYALHSCSVASKSGAKKYWIHFAMKRGSLDFFSDYSLPILVHLNNLESACKIFENTISASQLNEPLKSLETSKGIYELVLLFLKKCHLAIQKEDNSTIEKAVEFLNVNYKENLTLENLSNKFGYTPNYFVKKFKSVTGYTPIKYLTEKKIQEAKKLLEFTDLSVLSVMKEVGYIDASHFSKAFKKSLGYSPRAFREIVSKNITKTP